MFSTMAWSRLAALTLTTAMAIPAYQYFALLFDSRIFALMIISLLLIPVLSALHCLLDPCVD